MVAGNARAVLVTVVAIVLAGGVALVSGGGGSGQAVAQGCARVIYAITMLGDIWKILPDIGTYVKVTSVPQGFSISAGNVFNELYIKSQTGDLYRYGLTGLSGLTYIGPGTFGNSLSEGYDGFLYQGDSVGAFRQIDPATAFETALSAHSGYAGDIAATSFNNARGAVGPAAGGSNLVTVDLASGVQQIIGPFVVGAVPLGPVWGLAFTQDGTMWAAVLVGGSFSTKLYTVDPASGAATFVMNIELPITDLASQPSCAPPPTPVPTEYPMDGDLGDAPDSSNHSAPPNNGMSAYAGIPAHYPSVFDITTGSPVGPIHFAPAGVSLGSGSTEERDADVLPDQDTVTNIAPGIDAANRDGSDDGITGTLILGACAMTSFQYTLTVANGVAPVYANAWFDLNRDGDWGDSVVCIDPVLGSTLVSEWALRNQTLSLPNGTHTVVTPAFRSNDPGGSSWMRIGVTAVAVSSVDGRGTLSGYGYGETEDYLLIPQGGGVFSAE